MNQDNSAKSNYHIGLLRGEMKSLADDNKFINMQSADDRLKYIENIISRCEQLSKQYGDKLNLKEHNTMKKSELKTLLKIITEEVVAAKRAQLNEAKGLSGMKKAAESTEHTEKVAASKDLTGPAPKEKREGKKLPVVKKPANPQKVGNLKEEILQMIREEIDEMARVKGAVGNKFKVEDPSSPTGWVVKGHKTIPDGTPVEGPKGNVNRPNKDVGDIESGSDDDVADDEAAPESSGSGVNTKVAIVVDGDEIGDLDLAKIRGSLSGYLSSMLRARNFVLKLNPEVNAKLDEFSDLFADDKLPSNATLNLSLGATTIDLA